jgi:hypothetical protein
MNKSWRADLRALIVLLFAAAPAAAGELALYYLPGAQVEYEGTGFRQVHSGWELKVKPKSAAAGLRWRHPLRDDLAVETQFWRNQAFFAREDGNSVSATLRQTGQTRLTLNHLMADLRHPLLGGSLEAVLGAQGVHETFERRDVVFHAAAQPGAVTEALDAAGAYIGFHASRAKGRWYADGELLLGHLFLTGNRQSTGGGSIRRDGYTYMFRAEAGYRRGRWRAGVGYVRQMLEVLVPGGKTFGTGAAASLPINKTDFFSPALTVAYEY